MVLVTAAAGGGGHFAIQFAKRMGAAKVIATVGSDKKAAAVASLCCADRIINYKKEDVNEVLKSECPFGIDVAFEGVGGRMFISALNNMSHNGKLLVAGYISEYPHTMNTKQRDKITKTHTLLEKIFWNSTEIDLDGMKITGQLWPKLADERAAIRSEVFSLSENGAIFPLIDRSKSFVGLDSCVDAVEYMLSGESIGKVVVDINPDILDQSTFRESGEGDTFSRSTMSNQPEYYI